MSRPSWENYFVGLAQRVSERATCDRLRVGAVFVRKNIIIATGYNGSLSGLPHCDDAGHDMVDGHCVRVVHAEANAIAQAARIGASLLGTTLYCTAFPCWPCFRLCAQAGVTRVVFAAAYRDDPRVASAAGKLGIVLEPYTGEVSA